ncbi:MAG TPA: FAD:protein FMN transferase [Vicinamibacterales bacterium]|nr:FAD:protein FMN transferase [Vicinamibacterales bacterium]
MTDVYVHALSLMGTVVSFQVVGHDTSGGDALDPRAGVERAVAWFQRVEASCNRFDEASEVRQLSARIGVPVEASPMLFEAVRFAIAVAEDTGGAFDPTVGLDLEARGFNREYRSGRAVCTDMERADDVSFRDVHVDPNARTITLRRPLVLDLGAVAKGLAIDMAARELQPFVDFAVDAGGDLYLGGCGPSGEPWAVGIRDPRDESRLIDTLRVSDLAVCTSGDYARRVAGTSDHHILDPRSRTTASEAASVTVIAPTALAADALGTAAFVLGPHEGVRLLERHGVDGVILSPTLERFATRGMSRDIHRGDAPAPAGGSAAAILPHA